MVLGSTAKSNNSKKLLDWHTYFGEYAIKIKQRSAGLESENSAIWKDQTYLCKVHTYSSRFVLLPVVYKTQCENFKVFYHSDFAWNQFWKFLKCKISRFNTFKGSEFWFSWIFALFEGRYLPKYQKFTAPKMAKMAVLQLLSSPKLISRKIQVTEKSWNFHTVDVECCLFSRDAEA